MKVHQFRCGNPAQIWDYRGKVKDYDNSHDNHGWQSGTPPTPLPTNLPTPLTGWRSLILKIEEHVN